MTSAAVEIASNLTVPLGAFVSDILELLLLELGSFIKGLLFQISLEELADIILNRIFSRQITFLLSKVIFVLHDYKMIMVFRLDRDDCESIFV